MKHFLTITTIALLSSCSNSFINHELKAAKIGNCSNEVTPIKIISNINGERYEFEQCLDEGFDSKNYTVERKGDSLVVSFPKAAGKTALYNLILDIDAKPAYRSISLGGRTLSIKPAERL
jgi:argonaute-like protein implicated in RNA metabolism and viral defense